MGGRVGGGWNGRVRVVWAGTGQGRGGQAGLGHD